jgi:hypothetical protein
MLRPVFDQVGVFTMNDHARILDRVRDPRAGDGRLLAIRDHDGTLSSIVDEAPRAWLSASARGRLRALADVSPVTAS